MEVFRKLSGVVQYPARNDDNMQLSWPLDVVCCSMSDNDLTAVRSGSGKSSVSNTQQIIFSLGYFLGLQL